MTVIENWRRLASMNWAIACDSVQIAYPNAYIV